MKSISFSRDHFRGSWRGRAAYAPGIGIGIGILILAPILARPLHAQSIEDYLQQNIQGTGVEPGVTVATRSHPEYEAQPLHLGAFYVSPQVTETTGYDSNATGTNPAHGSAMIDTNASVQATSTWSRNSLGVNLGVEDVRLLDQPSQSYTNWSAAIAGTYEIGRSVLTASATHLGLTQTSSALDVPDLDSAIAYRVNDLRLDDAIPFSRLTLQPGFDFQTVDYDNGSVDGVAYEQTYRNRYVLTPSFEAHYELAPQRDVVVVLKDSVGRFPDRVAGVPVHNFNDVAILAGLDYDVDGLIDFRLLGGFENRTFESAAYSTISAPIFLGSLTYQPTGLDTITATVSRTIQDSASDTIAGMTATEFDLQIDHEYVRNVILTAKLSYAIDDYQQGGTQSAYGVGLGARWLINRNLQLALTYQFSSRQSDVDGTLAGGETQQAFGSSFTDNQILLQLRVTP